MQNLVLKYTAHIPTNFEWYNFLHHKIYKHGNGEKQEITFE